MQNALLAAHHVEQPRIQRFIPEPVETDFGESGIEGFAVGRFGIRQGPIDIENQGFHMLLSDCTRVRARRVHAGLPGRGIAQPSPMRASSALLRKPSITTR
jgi:hypothetical protein